jgi:hypothetical protein
MKVGGRKLFTAKKGQRLPRLPQERSVTVHFTFGMRQSFVIKLLRYLTEEAEDPFGLRHESCHSWPPSFTDSRPAKSRR